MEKDRVFKLKIGRSVMFDVTHNLTVEVGVIRGFRDKDTEAVYLGRRVRRVEGVLAQVERRLQILDSATCLDDLACLPNNRLEALGEDRKGQYSIRINLQWRIFFEWREDGPLSSG